MSYNSFSKIRQKSLKIFDVIEDNRSEQVFIPLEINITDEHDNGYLQKIKILISNKISGEKLFERYFSAITNKETDYVLNQIKLKKLTGLMSQFTISVYPKMIQQIEDKFDHNLSQYGFKYFSHWEANYSLEKGFNMNKINTDFFL